MSREIKGAFFAALLPLLLVPGLSRAEDTVRLSVTAGATYDTNVLLLPEKEKPACNFRLNVSKCGGDYVLSLSPQIELMHEYRRFNIDLQYRPTGNFYLGHPHLDYISHTASASVNGELSERTRYFLKDAYIYTMESLQATTTGIQTRRGAAWSNAAALGGDHDITPRSNIGLSLSDDIVWLKFPGTVSSRTDSAGLTDTYKATEKVSIRETYAFTNIYFASGFNKNIESHSLSAGVNYRATPSLVLDVSGGMFYTPETSRYNWIGSVNVSKTFQRSALTAGYSRGLGVTGLAAEESVNQSATLQWSYTVTDKFDIGVSGNYARSKTIPQTTVDVSSYTAGLTGSWRPALWATVSAGLTHFQQWAKGQNAEAFGRSTVFVNLTVVPFERRF